MSMVVQHNMQSMNANRMLNITTGQQAKSTEKLSSGYRINRAADDAAGLSISEKMRKQIRGLDRASSNAQDGVSAVQTAEGALTEVHSMLQRMNELATQASNGTNSKDDRQSIQNEISQLTTEIDRVAETTKFNESYLLKGATDGSKKTTYVNAHDAGIKGTLGEGVDGKTSFKLDSALKAGDTITVAGEELKIGDSKSVEDYAKLSEIGNTKVQIGDVYTKADGTAMTVTNKATQGDIENFIQTKANASDTDKIGTLKLADGTTYDITNKADNTNHYATITKTTSDGKVSTYDTNSASYSSLATVLGETSVDLAGATFTSADGKNTYDLVEKLNRDELTTFNKTTGTNVVDGSSNTTINSVLSLGTNGVSGGMMKINDSITTYTTVDDNKVETTKTAYADVRDAGAYVAGNAIDAGSQIVLTKNSVSTTWDVTNKATAADILASLKATTASTSLGKITLKNGTKYDLAGTGSGSVKVDTNTGASIAAATDLANLT